MGHLWGTDRGEGVEISLGQCCCRSSVWVTASINIELWLHLVAIMLLQHWWYCILQYICTQHLWQWRPHLPQISNSQRPSRMTSLFLSGKKWHNISSVKFLKCFNMPHNKRRGGFIRISKYSCPTLLQLMVGLTCLGFLGKYLLLGPF